VRAVAARALCETISDDLFCKIILIVICALRFEQADWNVLIESVLQRVARDGSLLHRFFWGLVGHADQKLPQGRRFKFLRKVLQGAISNEAAALFVSEFKLTEALCLVAAEDQRKMRLQEMLRPFEVFEQPVRLPLSPEYHISGISLENSRVMPSNAAPLWVNFVGIDHSINVIVKSGDDLRQDEFALLFADILNFIWKGANLPTHVVTYKCISVLDRIGLIEVVPGCKSVASIQASVLGALKKDPMAQYLQDNGKGNWMDKFMHSLAGSLIFEYLLGIGDRHGDNILLKQTGEIFHIDFGYLMGNKTYFGGINRETQPFTFTPAMLEVLGGKDSRHYREFCDICVSSFNEVRKWHVFLTGICMLVLGSNLPHLKRIDDVYHLRDALAIGYDDAQAETLWMREMGVALNTTRTQLNDAAHNLVQKFKK
jgi:phosphatidylinositol-4,5-bisphosphate 3-kinase